MTAGLPGPAVRVGLYFDLRNPPQWRRDPARLHAFTLEMCEEADHLGIDSLWFTEHHLFDDDYLPQPLTMAAAAAARTRTARIGTAVLVAPLHHSVEIAEQAAVVDLISGGRLELGLGAGYRAPEYELYGASPERLYATTDQRVRDLRRLWADGGATPRPVRGEVPIWMGYHGPQGARRAGLLGASLLTLEPSRWPIYRDALIEAGHDPTIARMGGPVQGWVSEDPDADWPVVAKHLAAQLDSYAQHAVEGTDRPVPPPVDPERLRGRDPRRPGMLDSFWIETPEDMATRIRGGVGDAPVETVFLWAGLPGMTEEQVAEHVRVVSTRLAPLLRGEPPSS